ncbi:TonB-dependent receptor plug domain-containing protein [Peredibacter sp. HCB2-198]|uniref:TonB-dependent receptor plug domain-containing protein n=1 Tax=Peredibacter sp. HCB2-198 TaxID=3383025 RepID=UPI0038B60488
MKSALIILTLFSFGAIASDEFTLGKIDVVARRSEIGQMMSSQVGSAVKRDDILKYNRNNVGDALDLLSGVTLSTNARNEKIISVRGFDSRQVPLFIDGIPVYVPFDGYVDFNRFTTADLASIQVAKGFSSVAYGPNTLGGAINLVSKRPTKALEADASLGGGTGDEYRGFANVGTNQGKWYLQSGASYIDSDYFPISGGDHRDNSYRKDGKLSVKLGLTPREGDEYALSYYIQNGEKGQPPSEDPTKVRYWQWPYWNKQSLYFVSQTVLTQKEILKARLYQDQFDNKIVSYTDNSYTTIKPSGPGSISTGKSVYHDRTIGGSLSLETYRLENQTISLVPLYKLDEHREFDANGAKSTFFKDELYSLGVEDDIKLKSNLSLTLGYSHHTLKPNEVYSAGNPYTLPHAQSANDYQAGLFFDHTQSSQIYATAAKKTRMPTMKDRYSQRLGTFVENPGLSAEQSLNLEIGHKGRTFGMGQSEIAIFYSDITDKIQTVVNAVGPLSQMQNIDKVRLYGMELGFNSVRVNKFEFGGNYTYTYVKNIKDPDIKIIDIPRHKAIGNATYRPIQKLAIIPFVEYNSRRWTSNTKELSGFTIYNLKASYNLNPHTTLEAGVNNLTDKSYYLADGFPSPGRMAFINANFSL